jgi:hypothetical protein
MMFFNPDIFDPDGGFGTDGDLIGLLDSNGREIIPAVYSRIDYAGHGLFIASSVNERDPFERGADRYLFTASGESIKVDVPKGGKFRRILWLGGIEMDSDSEMKVLPRNTLLTFIKNGRYGICDLNGNEIVEPTYDFICPPHENLCLMKKVVRREVQLSTFDVKSRQIKDLPLKNIDQTEFPSGFKTYGFFSEGLAALRFVNRDGEAGYGYVNSNGKIVIAPRWDHASPFINGMASVALSKDTYEMFLINKAGKVVSPPRLNVDKFQGDYAIASYRKKPNKFGVVNRKFEFVIKPDYEVVQTVHKRKAFSQSYDTITRLYAPADYFVCDRFVYSSDCRLLFEFPSGCSPNHVEVTDSYWIRTKNDQKIFFDLTGKEIPAPKSIEQQSMQRKVYLLAPDRYVLKINTDCGKFDSKIWALGPGKPISRLLMFERFLQERDLIGMSEDEVLELLGPGESRRYPTRDISPTRMYVLTFGGCDVESSLLLKLTMHNGAVESWCFSSNRKDQPSITNNVLILHDSFSAGFPKTIPKYKDN